jgi:hypothetical protein
MSSDNFQYKGKWIEFGEGYEAILVCPVCPTCHKFLKQGNVVFVKNGFGDIDHIDFESWLCKVHGALKPEWCWKEDVI